MIKPRLKPIHWIALIFAIQALLLAFFVTPPGDIPDESGHYAYVIDMTKGRPLPLLGKALIPSDLWKKFEGMPDSYRRNYIVQHPPLYYAVAALPYWIASQFTTDKHFLSLAPRTISALSLGLLILVLYKAMRAGGVVHESAIKASTLIGFVPMVMHLASGITNDIFLLLLCSFATLYLIKFIFHQRMIDAYICAFWLSLAGGTKMTAWVFIAGCLGILLFEMRQPIKRWIPHAVALSALGMSLPVWWMHRNYHFFGNPFKVNLVAHAPLVPNYSALDYLQSQPFFEWIYNHFYSLIGFSGYCVSADSAATLLKFCSGAQMTRVGGPSFKLFIALLGLATLIFAYKYVQLILSPIQPDRSAGNAESVQSMIAKSLTEKRTPRLMSTLGLLMGASLYVFLMSVTFHSPGKFNLIIMVTFTLVPALAVAGIVKLPSETSTTTRVIYYGPVLISLFLLLLFTKGVEAYRLVAAPAGLQGRYLYPFLPLLLVSVALAIDSIAIKRWVWSALVLGLAWAYANAYVDVIQPYFNLMRL